MDNGHAGLCGGKRRATIDSSSGARRLWSKCGLIPRDQNRFRHELHHGEQCLLHSPGRPVKRGLLSSLDTPSLRNLDFIVTDGQSFAERAQDSPTSTRLANPRLGRRKHGDDAESLTYQIVNTDTLNRWRLTMTYVTVPSPPTLLISVEFTSLNGLALPADGQMRSRMAFDQTPTPGLLAEL
jgi:hypothetical protein